MFDSETRLIFCNQRYIELYALSPEIVRPHCSLRDLLRHRIERGSFSGDPDKYTARLADGIAEGKTFSNVVNLPDGRAFSVVNKPVAGGGWLVERPMKMSPNVSVRKNASRTWRAMTR